MDRANEELYFLCREQASLWQQWGSTKNREYLDSFYQVTKMILRICILKGVANQNLLHYAHRCLGAQILIGEVEIALWVKDICNWDDKYQKALALDLAFFRTAKDASDMFLKATGYLHAAAVGSAEYRSALNAFRECVALAQNNVYAKQLQCQALHECGDVERHLGILAQEGEKEAFFQRALEYYKQAIAIAKNDFSSTIIADSKAGRARTLIELDPMKYRQEIENLFKEAAELYATAKDKDDKMALLDRYRDFLKNKIDG